MEVVAPLARSPDFRFDTATFSPYRATPAIPTQFAASFTCQYDSTSLPASPARFQLSPEVTTAARRRLQERAQSSFAPTPPRDSRRKSISSFPVINEALATTPPRNGQRKSISSFPVSNEALAATPPRNGQRKSISSFPVINEALATTPPRNGQRKSMSSFPVSNEGFFATGKSSSVKCGRSSKWPRLKDLLLFRSASEGREVGKDVQRKYALLPSDSPANKTVRRRSQPAVSPHEKHYTANRAAAEENRRKTPLPFQRHGLISFMDLSLVSRGKNKVASKVIV